MAASAIVSNSPHNPEPRSEREEVQFLTNFSFPEVSRSVLLSFAHVLIAYDHAHGSFSGPSPWTFNL